MKNANMAARALLLFSILLATGCAGKHIYTEIDIRAKPATVWAILMDNEKYPDWNPYHVKVEGDLVVGSKLMVEIHKPNGAKVEIDPHVMRIVPEKELTWGGGIRGVFHGEHVFILVPMAHRNTKLIHKEDFTGFAVQFASLEAIEEGYNLMNEALKARAEAFESEQ